MCKNDAAEFTIVRLRPATSSVSLACEPCLTTACRALYRTPPSLGFVNKTIESDWIQSLMDIRPIVGRCHLCGEMAQLTFEHIPPQQAFNNRGVLLQEMKLPSEEVPNGAVGKLFTYQRGLGSYSLCTRCNSQTGHWYGNHFVAFCKLGMNILRQAKYRPAYYSFAEIRPLPILKQIVSMIFTINSTDFRDRNVPLVNFVLNRDRRHLPPQYRFYLYFNHQGMHRATPITTKVDFDNRTLEHKRTSVMTELSYPPFGYHLSIDSYPPNGQLVEISRFAEYDYEEVKTLSMVLPVMPTHTFFPGDYRSSDQIRRDIVEKGGIVP